MHLLAGILALLAAICLGVSVWKTEELMDEANLDENGLLTGQLFMGAVLVVALYAMTH